MLWFWLIFGAFLIIGRALIGSAMTLKVCQSNLLHFLKISHFFGIRGHTFVVLELHPQVMPFHRNCTAKMLSPIGTFRIEHGSVAACITNEL